MCYIKGAPPALAALPGGDVCFMFVSILTATPLIESGKTRVIGVSSKKRRAGAIKATGVKVE